jgi:lipopolysaccharide transport system permease protein
MFFSSGTFNLADYGISWAITLLLLLIGIVLFSKVEKTFMDTV